VNGINRPMAERADLVPRHAESLVAEALQDTRVVLVNGARQAGKSTLTSQARTGEVGKIESSLVLAGRI